MPSFGDLVSNWYAARVLKARYPQIRINFYVSHAFVDRFQVLEPVFEHRDPHGTSIIINNIHVYWNSFGNNEAARNQVIDQLIESNNDNQICNMAFTTSVINIMGDTDNHPFSFYLVQRASQSNNVIKRNAPFLGFLFLRDYTDKRFCRREQAGITTRQPPRYPLYMFTGAVEAGSLLISEQHPDFNLPDYDLDAHLGFAYAHYRNFRMDYIQRIAQIARVNPAQAYVIVLGGSYDMNPIGGTAFQRLNAQSYMHLFIINANDPGVVQAAQDNREFYRLSNNAWEPDQLNNLYIVRYPNGVPFDVTQRVIRDTDLPVLVSGTMSLSLALQYDKPFIYEVMTHHRKFSLALHNRFVGLNGSGFQDFRVIAPYLSEVLRFEGFPYPVFDDFLGVVEEEKNVTELFDPDFETRRDRYHDFADEIRDYRLHLQRGQMLDNVLTYCDQAQAHYMALSLIAPSVPNGALIDDSIEDFRRNLIGDPPDPMSLCN
jgi:hypothetical protein